jgi:ribose 5-phosphate isomerase RpiB
MTDDNTNIICLAAGLSTEEHAMAMVKKWLATDFSQEERHVRRLKKIADSE